MINEESIIISKQSFLQTIGNKQDLYFFLDVECNKFKKKKKNKL